MLNLLALTLTPDIPFCPPGCVDIDNYQKNIPHGFSITFIYISIT